MTDANEAEHSAVKSFMCTDRLHHRVVDKYINSMGIHRSQNMLLMHLAHRGPMLSQREIAKELNVSPTAIAVKIKRLQNEGYIERTVGTDDSRTNTVKITEKGLKTVKRTENIFKQVDSAMLEGITEEQLKSFLDCIKLMNGNLFKILNGETEIFVEQGENTNEMV